MVQCVPLKKVTIKVSWICGRRRRELPGVQSGETFASAITTTTNFVVSQPLGNYVVFVASSGSMACFWVLTSSLREPHRPESQGLDFELSNLYITKEDLVEVFCNKFKAEVLKA